MPRLVHVLTVPSSLVFLEHQLALLQSSSAEVMLVTSPGPRLEEFAQRFNMEHRAVPMSRRITPGSDLISLSTLTTIIEDYGPDIVHAHTPKAGLLAMVAARRAGVQTRVYQMRGLVSLTARGARKHLLESAERVSCALARRVICQSPSLRQHAIERRIVGAAKSTVIGRGSNGVDSERFDRKAYQTAGLSIRKKLGIAEDDIVFGFVGRLVKDKGCEELVKAFALLSEAQPTAHLILVGPHEARDAISATCMQTITTHPRIHEVGLVEDVAPYYASFDVFVLPSHREGFPNACLEAASMALPVITTRAVGCRDSVDAGHTGVCVRVGSVRDLRYAMDYYARTPELRADHGEAGRKRVVDHFTPAQIAEGIFSLYDELLPGGFSP